MSPAAVRGVLELDLAPHLDPNGWAGRAARQAVHTTLAACPPHVAVRVHLGAASWVEPDVLLQLAELTSTAGSVEVVGSDPECLGRVVGALKDRLSALVA